MIQSSKSLLLKIHEILDGKQQPEQAEPVARDYVQRCQQINHRIKQFSKLIREGHYYSAIDVSRLDPVLTIQIEEIRFPREREWLLFLTKSGLPLFEGFNDNELKRVKEICVDSSFNQPKGYRDYRKAILLKDKAMAIQCLRKLYEDYPKDLNAKQELVRLETEAFDGITQQLADSLRRKDFSAVIDKVREVVEQSWLIQFQAESWDAGFQVYSEYQQKKLAEQWLQCLSQLKVIQRVGHWKDGLQLIEKLRQASENEAFQLLDNDHKAEIQKGLDWYDQCEIQENQGLLLQEKLKVFRQKLEPQNLTQGISILNKREIRLFQKTLQQEWIEIQAEIPEVRETTAKSYNDAQAVLNQAIAETSGILKFHRLFWVIALPSILLLAGGLYFIHKKEVEIAQNVTTPYEAGDLQLTEEFLQKWDSFTNRFLSNHNPFRNYSSHRKIKEIHSWVNDVHIRSNKIDELLKKIDSELEQSPHPSELRRIQMNMSIVEDLLGKLPSLEQVETSARIQVISQKINSIHQSQLRELRNDLIDGISIVESLTKKYFSAGKTEFQDVQSEISETRNAINALQLKFRHSFENDKIADLKEKFDNSISILEQFERAWLDLNKHLEKLTQSISLNEYLIHLDKINELVLPGHVEVKQVAAIHKHKSDFKGLAQQLLLPGNPLAWKEFIRRAEQPLFPESSSQKEIQIYHKLAHDDTLRSIYNYRVVRYVKGMQVDSDRVIQSFGKCATTRDFLQTSGRLIQTINQFDESQIGRGKPFSEKVYICRTNANGTPIEGDFLELDRLCPESGFYLLLDELCDYDPQSRQLKRPILAVIDDVKQNEFISPILKAYFTQELFKIMIIRAFDWGLNFSPTAQLDYQKLSKIKGTLYAYDWLRSGTQNRLSASLSDYYHSLGETSYHDQAIASRELFFQIEKQRIRYGGYIDAMGEFHILKSTPDDRKLFGLLEDGTFGTLRIPASKESPARLNKGINYTPLLFFNDPPSAILDRVSRNTGVDVRSDRFRQFLPSIFL